LWMKLNVAPRKGTDRARKLDSLSVPLRMKRWYIRWGVWRWDILSIFLRMKLHSAKERNGAHSDFQFLWGWNIAYITSQLDYESSFNSFEDETKKELTIGIYKIQLSIPLRMKL